MLRHIIRGWALLALLAGNLLASSPVITGFTPSVGSAGDTIMVTGSGFTSPGITFYFWQGIPAAYLYPNSDSQLTVIVPGGIRTGPLGVQLGNDTPAYTSTDFIAIGPGPYISDFSPAYGAVGDLITIDGAHLTNSPVVKFNGTASGEVSVNAAGSQLTARVPAGATSGVITVTTSLGTASSPGSFLVIGTGPYVTGFSPAGGGAGLQIIVTGVHFTGVTNVSFGNQPGVSLAVTSDSQLQVTTPSSVVSGPLTLSSSLGTFTTSSNFYVPPTLSSFSPANGRAGTNVTISGANFLGATSVKFGGLAASFTVVNNTSLRATVPNGVTNGLIRINTPMFSCFSASQFTVSPTISGFSPAFGPVGTSVTITGANLNSGTPSVWFNGVQAATPTGVSFGQITAVVPAGATTGPLTVSTSNGSTVSANNFLLPPSVSGFSPVAGTVGSRVTINGQNFLAATAVSFNGKPASSFTVTNNSVLGAVIPAGVITGPLSVSTPAGSAASVAVFYGVPGLTNFAPLHGTNGTSVTLSGTNLLGATAVTFNGVSAPINSNDGFHIGTSVPAGAQTGPISVVTPGGTSTTPTSFALDLPSEMAVWGTPATNSATLGSNLLYTISIVNYGPNAAPNVMVTNLLPGSVRLKSATINQGTLNTNGNPILGTLGTMVSGAAVTLQITVVPQALGYITNSMSVGSGNPDPQPYDNQATIGTLVHSPAVLSIQQLTNLVMVAWPADLTNCTLQAKNIQPTNTFWSNVLTAPVTSPNQLSVTEALTNKVRLYRLAR